MSINNAAGSSTAITDFSELVNRQDVATTLPPATRLSPRRRPKIKPIAYGLDDNDYPFESDSDDEETAAQNLINQLEQGTTTAQQKYYEHEVDGVTNMLGCAKVIDKITTSSSSSNSLPGSNDQHKQPPSLSADTMKNTTMTTKTSHRRPKKPIDSDDDDSFDENDLNMSDTELNDIADNLNDDDDDGNAGIDGDDMELRSILNDADSVFKAVHADLMCPSSSRPRKPFAIDARHKVQHPVKLLVGSTSDVFAPINDSLTANDLTAWNMTVAGNDNGNICDKSCQTDISCFDPDLLKHLMVPIESRCKKPFRGVGAGSTSDARNSNDFRPIKRPKLSDGRPMKYESNY